MQLSFEQGYSEGAASVQMTPEKIKEWHQAAIENATQAWKENSQDFLLSDWHEFGRALLKMGDTLSRLDYSERVAGSEERAAAVLNSMSLWTEIFGRENPEGFGAEIKRAADNDPFLREALQPFISEILEIDLESPLQTKFEQSQQDLVTAQLRIADLEQSQQDLATAQLRIADLEASLQDAGGPLQAAAIRITDLEESLLDKQACLQESQDALQAAMQRLDFSTTRLDAKASLRILAQVIDEDHPDLNVFRRGEVDGGEPAGFSRYCDVCRAINSYRDDFNMTRRRMREIDPSQSNEAIITAWNILHDSYNRFTRVNPSTLNPTPSE